MTLIDGDAQVRCYTAHGMELIAAQHLRRGDNVLDEYGCRCVVKDVVTEEEYNLRLVTTILGARLHDDALIMWPKGKLCRDAKVSTESIRWTKLSFESAYAVMYVDGIRLVFTENARVTLRLRGAHESK